MKRFTIIAFIFAMAAANLLAQKAYTYESVPNDPLKARIYTLDNGMKVYMSVDKNEPMIKATLATKAGSKLDPSETTGLAHYFEHLMFKGTKNFGTKDYAAEEPLLNEIERLFEEYRKIDESETKVRAALFKQIDSISQIASQYAIPNEYQKMMSIIGSKGTNAGTWIDFTNYYEEIPSNQLENYLIIQADRFQNPVLRLFHTELETIYEEKNMTLASDGVRLNTAMMEGLFPNHPYGTQTTIGTQQQLRNPSITNVKNFFNTYYVPNNMAFILSGDFDPEEAIALVDKYFGQIPSSPLPEFQFTPEKPITTPVVKEVVGKEIAHLMLAWRFDNPNSAEIPTMILAEMILTNGNAGLVDLNINQKQLLLQAGSMPMMLHDYSAMIMYAVPKAGQTLEEARDILLDQIDNLQAGNFPDWLLEACINDLRVRQIKEYESNDHRANAMETAFYLDKPWEDVVTQFDKLTTITKEQIVDFAKKYLRRDNYVVVYKRKGEPEDIEKVKKPKVTPIKINREDKSDFVKKIEDTKVPEIQPLFVDITKDMTTTYAKNNTLIYYTKNDENELFNLSYVFDYGSYQDKYMNYASGYMEYLGTDKYTPEQIKEEFYKIGCSYSMVAGTDRSYVTISGLSKNMEKAMSLFEDIVNTLQPNKEALDNMVKDVLKLYEESKGSAASIFQKLVIYGTYGVNSPDRATHVSEKELRAMTPEMLIGKIQDWMKYKQFVIYYGPDKQEDVAASVNKTHNLDNLKDVPPPVFFKEDVPVKTRIYVADFSSAQQVTYRAISFGEYYNRTLTPTIRMYNAYFGGGMSSIVFQELRESRALAYGVYSAYISPSQKENRYTNIAHIACGTTKMREAIEAFNVLIGDMPENDASFNVAKESTLSDYRTSRIRKDEIVWKYLEWQRLGLNEDPRPAVFAAIPSVSLGDIKQFQKEYVTGKPQTIVIVGNIKEMDMKYLKKLGKVKVLPLKEVFGY
ncbi:MAG: insulinase family protein [Lentimicrobiaceae bacterium]|nr:insulinase family protein [Lentimicrobiaceae bacterium]